MAALVLKVPRHSLPRTPASDAVCIARDDALYNDLSCIFHLTYAGRILRNLMVRGRSLTEVLPDLAAVRGFTYPLSAEAG